MNDIKKIYLSWSDVNKLINILTPRLQGYDFDVLIAITRGGVIPGGIIAEQLAIDQDRFPMSLHKLLSIWKY